MGGGVIGWCGLKKGYSMVMLVLGMMKMMKTRSTVMGILYEGCLLYTSDAADE